MAVLKDLIVHGSSRFLNGAQFNTINAESIGATEGIFNKLIATTLEAKEATITDLTAENATVTGLLDVQGQMHTNSWTNANIATIDGNFFITPTIGVAYGAFTYNGTDITVSGVTKDGTTYKFGTDSNWVANSLVMITGQVAGADAMMPLGTIRGKLKSVSSTNGQCATVVITGPFSDGIGGPCTTLENIGTVSGVDAKDIKISLYQKKVDSGLAPLGIYMTSGGMSTQNMSFIDIYNGGNIVSTAPSDASGSSGAFAKPVLRIGNLSHLGTVGGQTVTGYGIYTTNGFFEGVITAKKGYIGGSTGWTIDTTNIHAPSTRTAWNTNASGIWIAADVIAGGAQTGSSVSGQYASTDPKWYIKANGDVKFGELTYINGTLTVPAAKVTGTLAAGTIQTNVLSALQAKLGTLTSNSLSSIVADIGTITAGVIKHDTVGGTNGIWFSAATDTSSNVTVGNSTARKDWRLLVNNKFGVTTAGNLYASSADITGSIDATSFIARANNIIRAKVDSTGLLVYDATGSGNTPGVSLVEFGTTTYIGKHNNTQSYIQIDYHSLQMIDKDGNPYFYVSDLRGTDGIAQIVLTYTGNSSNTVFSLTPPASNTNYTVVVSDDSGGTITKTVDKITFASAPNNGSTITITYNTKHQMAKAYSVGIRRAGSNLGGMSVAEGWYTEASGRASHAEGSNTTANGNCSHAEGFMTTASGNDSHSEGYNTTASGDTSHTEGTSTTANGNYSHAEGFGTTASGTNSHSEGYETTASGHSSHAEGANTIASGRYSHSGGENTIAKGRAQTVIGTYNIEDASDMFAAIVGNGVTNNTRSNALTIDWDGNVNIASGAKYKINGTALSAADVSAVALSNKYTRSSAGGLDWSNQTDGDAKIIAKSALAFWNGSYDGSTSNLTRFKASNGTSYSFGTLASKNSLSAADVGAVPKSVCCFANSVVRTPSSGTITFTLSELGITNNQKPVGILMTYQDGGATPTILRYDYDASSASGVIVKVYDANGNAVSSAVRFFMMVFQGSWTSV